MLLCVQNSGKRLHQVAPGQLPASAIRAITASHLPYNATVNKLDYASFTDLEPEGQSTSVSGYGSISSTNTTITMEFTSAINIKEVLIQTLKAATTGSWGINYLSGVLVQAQVNGAWETCFTFPSLPNDTILAPDGKKYNERWANAIPIGRTCTALRLLKTSGYVCASTFAPIAA